jgi:hypothetical protein
MPIVHPAFCVVGREFDGTNRYARVPDTKYFKNRVYSSRTADVFSASNNATRQ